MIIKHAFQNMIVQWECHTHLHINTKDGKQHGTIEIDKFSGQLVPSSGTKTKKAKSCTTTNTTRKIEISTTFFYKVSFFY